MKTKDNAFKDKVFVFCKRQAFKYFNSQMILLYDRKEEIGLSIIHVRLNVHVKVVYFINEGACVYPTPIKMC